jgi:hypothetical protein
VSADGTRVLGSFEAGSYGLAVELANDVLPPSSPYGPLRLYVDVFAGNHRVTTDTLDISVVDPLDVPAEGPPAFALSSVRPQPAAGRCRAELALPAPGRVRAVVFDLLGRRVRTLADAPLAAGNHTLEWDGDRDDGTPAGPGLYLLKVAGDGRAAVARIVRVR